MAIQDTDLLLVNRNNQSFRETFENIKDEINANPPTDGQAGHWDRTGTTLSPTNAGDTIATDDNAVQLVPGTTGSPLVRDANGNLGVGIAAPPLYNANLRTVSFNGTNGVVHDYAVNGTRTGSIVTQATGMQLSTQTATPIIFTTDEGGAGGEAARLDPAGVFTLGDHATPAVTLDPGSTASPLVRDANGRLGVGVAAPTKSLEISGDFRLPTNQTISWGDDGCRIFRNTNDLRFDNGGVEVGTFTSTGVFGVGTAAGYAVSLDPGSTGSPLVRDSNGNLGVGVTTPADWNANYNGPRAVIGSTAASACGVVLVSTGNSRLDFSNGTGPFNQARASITYDHTTDDLRFRVNNNDRATIDKDGRLLVGGTGSQSTLGARFQVFADNAAGGTSEFFRSADDAFGASLDFSKSRGTLAAPTNVAADDALGTINFTGWNAAYGNAASITAHVDGALPGGGTPGRLVFSTTPSGGVNAVERMRIRESGFTEIASSAAPALFLGTAFGAVATNSVLECRHSSTGIGTGTLSFRVWANGDAQNTNNSYGAISDIKLKENIVDAKSQWDDIKGLRLVNYNFKAETGNQTHKQLGLIAQEVEKVCPGLVGETEDTDADGKRTGEVTKNVAYSVLYMKAVGALQEAMARIEALEAIVVELTKKVA